MARFSETVGVLRLRKPIRFAHRLSALRMTWESLTWNAYMATAADGIQFGPGSAPGPGGPFGGGAPMGGRFDGF